MVCSRAEVVWFEHSRPYIYSDDEVKEVNEKTHLYMSLR